MAGAAELGVGYLSILPETSKIAPGINAALNGVQAKAAKQGSSWGSKFSLALKGSLAAAGVAAGAALGTSMAKGMARLTAIDEAQAKLKGLGNSADTVAGVMQNALASVKGTAYGLGEAASTAAGMVAAGIQPGQQLETTLKTVADTAAIAGASMQDVGVIFGSVAARGKLQGDDMLQLLGRGVPVLQLLAAETGKTSAEVSKMVSDGKIDFATFEAAMRRGMGGAAQEMGNTFTGALANMQAAMGRFGAELNGPLFAAAPGVVKGITSIFDQVTAAIKPKMTEISAAAGVAGNSIGDILSQKVGPAAADAAGKMADLALQAVQFFQNPANTENLRGAFDSLKEAAIQIGPTFADLGKTILSITGQISVATWQAFGDVLNAAAPIIRDALVPALQQLSGFMKDHPALVQAFVGAWLGSKAISTAAGPIQNVGGAISKLGEITSTGKAATGLLKIATAADGKFPGLASKILSAAGGLETMGAKATSAGGLISKLGTAAANPIKNIAGSALTAVPRLAALAGPWGLVAAGAATAGVAAWGFFTKTETGKAIWQGVVDAFKAGMDWLGNTASSIWDGVKAGWETFTGWLTGFKDGIVAGVQAIGDGIKTVLETIAAAALTPFVLAWDLFGGKITEVWNTVSSTVQSIGGAISGFVQNAASWLGDKFSAIWDAVSSKVSEVWNKVTSTVKNIASAISGFVQDAASWLGDRFAAIWDAVTGVVDAAKARISAAFQALASIISGWWNANVQPVLDRVKAKFTEISSAISNAVHGAITSAINTAKGLFEGLAAKVEGIVNRVKAAWDALKSAVATPINLVVNAFGKAQDIVQGVTAATGGAIYGPGTATSDSIPALLSNGEHVITAAEVKKAGGQAAIYRLRAAIRAGKMPRFASGGAVGALGDLGSLAGTATVNVDFSSLIDGLTDLINTESDLAKARDTAQQAGEKVEAAEENLASAREQYQKELDGMSLAQREATLKVAQAERNLQEARNPKKGAADPLKIAQAEIALQKARENAANVGAKAEKQARKVAQAEKQLEQARKKQAQAIAELEKTPQFDFAGFFEKFGSALEKGLSAALQNLQAVAAIGEKAREDLNSARATEASARLTAIQSTRQYLVDSQNLTKTQLAGATKVKQAEARLAEARRAAGQQAISTIWAAGGEIDRFRVNSVFGIQEVAANAVNAAGQVAGAATNAAGQITGGITARTAEVAAAEWGLAEARNQQLLEQNQAAAAATAAAYQAKIANLEQAQAAELLRLATENMKKNARDFFNMSQNQVKSAQAANKGGGGLFGGIGRFIGGVVKTVRSVATLDFAGAAEGVSSAISGVSGAVAGFHQLKENWGEFKQAWSQGGWLDKARLIGGGLLSFGGGVASGFGLEVGNKIAEAGASVIGDMYSAERARVEHNQRVYEDQVANTKDLYAQAIQNQKDAAAAAAERFAVKQEIIQTNIDYTQIQQAMLKATSEGEVKALADQARAAAAARDQMISHLKSISDELSAYQTKADASLGALEDAGLSTGRSTAVTIELDGSAALSPDDLQKLLDQINGVQDNVDLALSLVNKKPSGLDYVSARR